MIPGGQLASPGSKATSGSGAYVKPQPPQYGYRTEPHYPRLAVRRGYQGTVLLRVYVLEDGHVATVQIKESSGYKILDDAAVQAVRNWRFNPGRLGERHIASWVLVPISFKLEM
ncbi:MAG: energy transducer TonB [Deltaproteobacteria bacterium]|nr:energy transducer TonB [Deltaproteobacteria bacterium]MBW2071509.1 energy transducer TonB [Deltaproteobacteria bacterium]